MWQRNSNLDAIRELNNQLAQSKQLIKETQTAYSSQATEVQDLKVKNSNLQSIIKKNKQEILAISDVALKWKDKYFEIKNANQNFVDGSGSQPVSLPSSLQASCDECLNNIRIRVDFEKEQDNLKISGYTLTNPAYASINLEWLKDLQLQLVLTKDENGIYQIHLDSENQEVVPVELNLKVDPSVLDRKWYEKIGLYANLALGNSMTGDRTFGGLFSLGASYLITPRVNLGINVNAIYNGNISLYYGVFVNYFPFYK